MTKKFSELSSIITPANTDLFALSDVSETESKKITFTNLKSAIIDETTFDYGSIITKLNAYNPTSTGKNGLFATKLYANSTVGYQEGSYFLEYSNLAGKPTIPVDLTVSTNNTVGFLRYNSDTNGIEWAGSSTVLMTSSNLPEGTNLYYTDARAKANLVDNFAEQFNIYNSTFDQGDVRDSVYGLSVTFPSSSTQVSGGQQQSKTIRITGDAASSIRAQFSVGQTLRIYGASTTFESTVATTSMTLSVQGFTEISNDKKVGTIGATYSYKVSEFDYETGEISAASSAQTKTIYVPTTGGANSVADQFNTSHFIRVNLGSVPADKGVAVYRRIGTTGDYKLSAVLGRKEIDAGSWIDYQAFDYNGWSGKNSTDNTYITSIHFPLTASSATRRGWVDKNITAITQNTTTFDMTIDDWVFINSPDGNGEYSAQICHNDTSIIQTAISNNSAIGKKSIVLNAKTYCTSQLSMPNNFGLVGTSYITKIRKLPWTGGEASALNGKFIIAQTATGAQSLSIVGVDIDGTAHDQFLWPDSTTINRNYLLDFGINCNSLLLDRVRITNAPAGGVYATSPIELKINTSEITDSGTTDRYEYSPLIADSGTDTMIVGNRFQNYTDYVDVSVTNKGIVANNVINNCGSGLFVYGSVFFVSSPNVLMGPAQEFLPTPDILNSEYDLINIDLSEAKAAGDDYDAPSHVYQENGAAFDLSATAGSINDITHRAFYIQKTAQGVEEVYGTTTTAGSFQVTNPATRYTILTLGTTSQSQWNTAAGTSGVVYSVGDTFNAAGVGAGNGTATSGGVDTIQIIDVPAGQDRTLGEFAFTIPVATVNAIKDASGAHSYSTLKAANSLHEGIGWSSTFRNEVSCGSVSGAGTWTVDAVNGTDPTYEITVSNLLYASVGKRVRFDSHTGFSNSGNVNTGTVESISTNGATSVVTIKFKGAGGGQVQASPVGLVAGANGTLNIIDSFVMAQGRII
jgi:hypothetical protein